MRSCHIPRVRANLLGLTALALLVAGPVAAPAHAQAREDGATATALGVADTVRASAAGATALYFNPAGMSRLRQYAFEANYSFLNDLSGHAIGIAAVDSSTNQMLAMGVAYNYLIGTPGGVDRDGHNVRGGLSSGYATQDFGIYGGVGGRYTSLTRGRSDSATNGEIDDVEFFTIDAGLLLTISDVFRLGVVGQNLIDTQSISEAPRLVAVGAAVQLDVFEIAFDTVFDLQTNPDEVLITYSVGAQLLLKEIVVLRLGFVADGVKDTNRIAAGASYVSQLIGVDLGFQRSIDRGDDTIVSLGLKVFLP